MARRQGTLERNTGLATGKPGPTHRTVALIRQRDWIGIAIELAVVTIGILLAFQIDQWGQDRRQRRDEGQFLERMWRETGEAISENDWAIRFHAGVRKGAIEGLGHANDKTALAQMSRTMRAGCGLSSFPGLGFNDTSYEELSTSGRLNIISDPDLRSELREVAAAQADSVTQLNYSRSFGIAIFGALQPYLVLGVDQSGNSTCRVNWTPLLDHQAARNAVVRALSLHTLMWQKRAYARDVLATAHNRIACHLRKADCLAKVPQIIGYRPMNDALPPALSRKAVSSTGK